MSTTSIAGKSATLLVATPRIEWHVTPSDYERRENGTKLFTIKGTWLSKDEFKTPRGLTYQITEGGTDTDIEEATDATLWLPTDNGQSLDFVGQIHSMEWIDETPQNQRSEEATG